MSATENITAVFTDLVGSTQLASALAPEAADELRRRHFSMLRQAIAACGGVEVKNLGDGLMVVFPVASAALNCAVAMQQAVCRANVGSDQPLGLRVGLSSGEVTQEGDDYFGDPVVEAARLCTAANAGQILASDIVRASAGRRSSHTFRSLGAFELKGLPDPVEALEVGWEPVGRDQLAHGGVPLPARLAHRPGVGIIGRAAELANLEAAAKRVASGDGREVVLVAGEPGQGKSTLVAELARHAHDAGMTVLFGHCDEEVGAPYLPFSEALAHYVTYADEGVLRSCQAAHGGELARLVPAFHERLGELPAPQTSDADTERYLVYAAVVGLLDRAADERPVVLVLDDLHWADRPSLRLLRHVVANCSSARLLVLTTYRDAELSSAHPLTEALAALHREPTGVSSLDLRGFDDATVLEFMESAAGHELDDAGVGLAHALYRETDGNPFFVAEVLRSLSESGAIYQDETGHWTARDAEGVLALPNSVRAVIGTRVSRLGQDATRILSVASVIGREFDLDLLAESTAMDEDGLIDLLEQAQRATVTQEVPGMPGRYTFYHALIQHTLYEDMGETRRARQHRAVGEAMERLYGPAADERVGELARHFMLATRPTDAEKAISYSCRAAEAALKALAPEDAVRYFSQAQELATHAPSLDERVRIDLLIGLGRAQEQAGIPDFRETLLDAAGRARRAGDSDRLALAALANNRGWFSSLGHVDVERVEVLDAALAAIPDIDSRERALLLATLCSELTYGSSLEQRMALHEEAKAIARRLGDSTTLVDVINLCEPAIRCSSTIDVELENVEELFAAPEVLEDPYRLFRSSVSAYPALVAAGRFDEASQRVSVLIEQAEQLRQPRGVWIATSFAAAEAARTGDAAAAEELATAAFEVGSASGQPDAFSFYGSQLMAIRRLQGRYGEIVPLVEDIAARNPESPVYRAVLAAARMEGGDEAGAKALFDEAAASSFTVPEDAGWSITLVLYARVAIELQLRTGIDALIGRLAPYHGQIPTSGISHLEPIAMYLGGLVAIGGRYDDAGTYFEEAARLNARGETQWCEAYTNLLWGRMLRRRAEPGDVERARSLLHQSHSTAAALGYGRVERLAAAELADLS